MRPLLLLALLCAGTLYAASAEWLTDYDAALAKAKSENKPVLVDFTGSDWCIWCIKLEKEVFSQAAFEGWAPTNVVLLKLDFPRSLPQDEETQKKNATLADLYKINGFPTILVLNAQGDEVARTGYRRGGAQAYVQHLEGLLK